MKVCSYERNRHEIKVEKTYNDVFEYYEVTDGRSKHDFYELGPALDKFSEMIEEYELGRNH